MKVYGWYPMMQHQGQVRAIVAAKSFAAANRASEAAKLGRIHKDYVSTTGNPVEIDVAQEEGVVYWAHRDIRPTVDAYQRVKP